MSKRRSSSNIQPPHPYQQVKKNETIRDALVVLLVLVCAVVIYFLVDAKNKDPQQYGGAIIPNIYPPRKDDTPMPTTPAPAPSSEFKDGILGDWVDIAIPVTLFGIAAIFLVRSLFHGLGMKRKTTEGMTEEEKTQYQADMLSRTVNKKEFFDIGIALLLPASFFLFAAMFGTVRFTQTQNWFLVGGMILFLLTGFWNILGTAKEKKGWTRLFIIGIIPTTLMAIGWVVGNTYQNKGLRDFFYLAAGAFMCLMLYLTSYLEHNKTATETFKESSYNPFNWPSMVKQAMVDRIFGTSDTDKGSSEEGDGQSWADWFLGRGGEEQSIEKIKEQVEESGVQEEEPKTWTDTLNEWKIWWYSTPETNENDKNGENST